MYRFAWYDVITGAMYNCVHWSKVRLFETYFVNRCTDVNYTSGIIDT